MRQLALEMIIRPIDSILTFKQLVAQDEGAQCNEWIVTKKTATTKSNMFYQLSNFLKKALTQMRKVVIANTHD